MGGGGLRCIINMEIGLLNVERLIGLWSAGLRGDSVGVWGGPDGN